MTTPADLAYPDSLPDDFKLLLSAQRIPPDDPLLIVLAWHWSRINQNNDALQESGLALKVALDERIRTMTGAAQALQEVTQHLDALNRLLEEKPSVVGRQVEAELTRHAGDALAATQGIAQALTLLLKNTEGSIRRLNRERFAAAFISGLCSGAMLIPWTSSHFFSR